MVLMRASSCARAYSVEAARPAFPTEAIRTLWSPWAEAERAARARLARALDNRTARMV